MRASLLRATNVTLAAALAPALLVAAAAPASAAPAGNCGYQQYCFATTVDDPVTRDLTVVCGAAGPATAQVTVVSCYVVGNNGDVHYGPRTLTSGISTVSTWTVPAWSRRSTSYTVCVGAGYYSTGGTYYAPANYICGSTV